MLFDTRVRRRFHQSVNSCELEGDLRGTDARSLHPPSTTVEGGPRKGDRGSSARLVEAPVSYGREIRCVGKGGFSKQGCEREREREVAREDELREAQIEGTGLRKGEEGSRGG